MRYNNRNVLDHCKGAFWRLYYEAISVWPLCEVVEQKRNSTLRSLMQRLAVIACNSFPQHTSYT